VKNRNKRKRWRKRRILFLLEWKKIYMDNRLFFLFLFYFVLIENSLKEKNKNWIKNIKTTTMRE